jgi:hypothetical protein
LLIILLLLFIILLLYQGYYLEGYGLTRKDTRKKPHRNPMMIPLGAYEEVTFEDEVAKSEKISTETRTKFEEFHNRNNTLYHLRKELDVLVKQNNECGVILEDQKRILESEG